MNWFRNSTKKNKIISITTSIIILFSFTTISFNKLNNSFKNSNQYNELKRDFDDGYVPNNPTWYDLPDSVAYVDGYIPQSEFYGPDGFNYEEFSESFSYKDNGSHHPPAAQIYQNWFKNYKNSSVFLGTGGSEEDVVFEVYLPQPEVNEVNVQYYVESIKINEIKLFAESGKIKEFEINFDNVFQSIFDAIEGIPDLPDWVNNGIEWVNKFKDWLDAIQSIIMPAWPDEPESWSEWQDYLNIIGIDLPDWPSSPPSWYADIPKIIYNTIKEVLAGNIDTILAQAIQSIIIEVIWFGLGKIPGVGVAFRLFHEFVSLGIIWETRESMGITTTSDNGRFIDGKNHEVNSDGSLELNPTYSSGESVIYEDIFEFNNNIFNEDQPHKNTENIKLEYSWQEKTNYINLKVEGINDFKTDVLVGGSFSFLNAIEFNGVQEKVVYLDSNYSLSNDEFGDFNNDNNYYKKTEENLFNFNADILDPALPTNLGIETPFFTSQNSYSELEEVILNNRLIESRDRIQNIDSENFYLEFYDEYDTVIDKSKLLDSANIRLKIKTNNSREDLSGETEILNYEIPYIDLENVRMTNNIFDYEGKLNNPSSNKSISYFDYNKYKNKWTLITNQQITLDLLYSSGVRKVIVDYPYLNDIDVNLDQNTQYIKDLKLPFEQATNHVINEKNISVRLFDKGSIEMSNIGVSFDISYKAIPDPNVISITDTKNNKLETSINTIDFNEDNKILGYEIFDSISTNEIVKVESYKSISKYKLTSEGWEYISENNSFTVEENGIYGFSSIDDWGNNKFIVVEKLDKVDSKLEPWIGSKEYEKDKQIFLEQENSSSIIYSSYSTKEYEYINYLINFDLLSDIQKVLAKQPLDSYKLSSITNKYEDGKFQFDEETIVDNEKISLKDNLEREIELEMEERGFSSNTFSIQWEESVITDSTVISNNLKELKYTLVPEGYWNSMNYWSSSIKLYEYQSLENFIVNEENLEFISNSFKEGVEFDETVVNTTGEAISLKSALNREIIDELRDFGIENKELTNLNIEWNVKDEEVIYYGTELKYSITFDSVMVKGNKQGWINSKTMIDLSKITLNNKELREVSNEFFDGVKFKELRLSLEEEIFKQLSLQGVVEGQVAISFFWENGLTIADYETIKNGDIINYEIYSTSSKYYGKFEGQFESDNFKSLDQLRIPVSKLEEITNHYIDGTKFDIVQIELDDYINETLIKKGLDIDKLNVEWFTPSENLKYHDGITLEITSRDFEYAKGSYSLDFYSKTYFDLLQFKIDENKIIDIVHRYVGTEKEFSVLRKELENEIEKELTEQGYNTSVIIFGWNIGDKELLISDKVIKLNIKGTDKKIVHGELNYTFNFDVPDTEVDEFNWWILLIIFGSLSGVLMILATILIVRNRREKNKDKKNA